MDGDQENPGFAVSNSTIKVIQQNTTKTIAFTPQDIQNTVGEFARETFPLDGRKPVFKPTNSCQPTSWGMRKKAVPPTKAPSS